MVNTDMLNNANFGANLTTPPTEATADYSDAKWYAIAEDSNGDSDGAGSEGGEGDNTTIVQTFAPLTTAETQYNVFSVNGKFIGRVSVAKGVFAHIALKNAGFSPGAYIVRNQNVGKLLIIK